MPERMRACTVKCGEFINNKTVNQSLFVFLLLHAMEGAINFGHPVFVLVVCFVLNKLSKMFFFK